MTILGLGIDLCGTARMQALIERKGEAFLERVFTPAERLRAERHADPTARARSFAGRFAAKEAVLKALGTGLGSGMRWRDVDTAAPLDDAVERPDHALPPVARLHGLVAELAAERGVTSVLISITHEDELAAAVAVLSGPSA